MEKIMSRLVHFSVKYRVWVIAATAVLTLFFGGFATQIQFNPNIESMVPGSDISKKNFEEMGIASSDYIAYTATADDAFTPEQLRRFDAFINEVLKLEGIKGVKSPFNQIEVVKKCDSNAGRRRCFERSAAWQLHDKQFGGFAGRPDAGGVVYLRFDGQFDEIG